MVCPIYSTTHAVEIVPGTHFFLPLRGGGVSVALFTQQAKTHANTVTKINQLSKLVIVLKKTKMESEHLEGERKRPRNSKALSLPVKKPDPKYRTPAFGSLLCLTFTRQM